MPIRFSTEAANADILGEDMDTPGTPEGMTRAVGADGTQPDRYERRPKPGGKSADASAGEAKPGKDINAPGFIKDKDAAKP